MSMKHHGRAVRRELAKSLKGMKQLGYDEQIRQAMARSRTEQGESQKRRDQREGVAPEQLG